LSISGGACAAARATMAAGVLATETIAGSACILALTTIHAPCFLALRFLALRCNRCAATQVYHLFTLRFAIRRTRVKYFHHRNFEGVSMVQQTIERLRHASSWILSPSDLIDRFLDQLDDLCSVVAPIEDRSEMPVEARLDQFGGWHP
jgi:hypothetical protein